MKRVITVRTPTGPVALIRPVAEKLLANGVVSGEIDGDLHATDAATVKAAIMATAVCDFCSSMTAPHSFDVPDFQMPLGVGKSIGAWGACDDCAKFIWEDKRKSLLDRAVELLSFSKFTRPMITELHSRFWAGMDAKTDAAGAAAAIVDFVNGKIAPPSGPIDARDERIERVAKRTGLSTKQIRDLVDTLETKDYNSQVLVELLDWKKRFAGKTFSNLRLSELLTSVDGGPRKPLEYRVPHWQEALDSKFRTVALLGKMLDGLANQTAYVSENLVDLNDTKAMRDAVMLAQLREETDKLGYSEDRRMLTAAEAYSFNGETIAAIREASASVPHDAPLSSIETPNVGAGWFWFGDAPLDIRSNPVVSDKTHALLWGWVDVRPDDPFAKILPEGPSLVFSAYTLDEKGDVPETVGTMIPSTRWFWPLGLSFHDMLSMNSEQWRKAYGVFSVASGNARVMSEEETLSCIADLSLFFVMACLWFKQTVPILTRAPGHVERHARKRLQREHKLAEPPRVSVVALRKSARSTPSDAPSDRQESAREYSCRWIVKGHPRLQSCGPGRKDRKLIWIDAYPKGPEDKPLRTREKVYAVIR